jgi:hypothetical protein
MFFKFKHPESGEIKDLLLSEKEMADLIDDDDLLDAFCSDACKCESVGETNVVDCGCGDYLPYFERFEETPTKVDKRVAFEIAATKKGYSLSKTLAGDYEDNWLQEAWSIHSLVEG